MEVLHPQQDRGDILHLENIFALIAVSPCTFLALIPVLASSLLLNRMAIKYAKSHEYLGETTH